MRLLGVNDYKDYLESFKVINRTSARMIIIEDGKIFLSHAKRNNTYKLPGGGVNDNEDIITTAIRETLEEVGVVVDKKSIKEYGYYIEKWKSVRPYEDNYIWQNTSYYYIANKVSLTSISPTSSEIYDMCESVLVDIDKAIIDNERYIKKMGNLLKDRILIREVEILKIIKNDFNL